MELPAAVKAGAERAEALQKQLADRKPRDNQKGTTPRPEAQTADGTPEDGRDTSQVADVAQKQTQQTVDSPRLNSDQPQADPVKDGDEGAWKQRYLTLKGKFDAQVPKMNHEIRNLQDTVSVLEQENGQLKQAAAENNWNSWVRSMEGLMMPRSILRTTFLMPLAALPIIMEKPVAVLIAPPVASPP